MTVKTEPGIARPDDFFAELMAVHNGLDERQSAALNARLILLMANCIGDDTTLVALLRAAREQAANGPD